MDITSNAGSAGSFSFDDSSPLSFPSTGRGRSQSANFGIPERTGLLDLATTYLETQARLWPDLAGTPAVPKANKRLVASMADSFERGEWPYPLPCEICSCSVINSNDLLPRHR